MQDMKTNSGFKSPRREMSQKRPQAWSSTMATRPSFLSLTSDLSFFICKHCMEYLTPWFACWLYEPRKHKVIFLSPLSSEEVARRSTGKPTVCEW